MKTIGLVILALVLSSCKEETRLYDVSCVDGTHYKDVEVYASHSVLQIYEGRNKIAMLPSFACKSIYSKTVLR